MIAKHWDVQFEGKSFVCIWNPWISYMGMHLQMKSVQVLYRRVCEGTLGKKVSPPCYFRPHAFTESNEISVTDTSSCDELHLKFSSNMLSLPQLLHKSPSKSSKGAPWYFRQGTHFFHKIQWLNNTMALRAIIPKINSKIQGKKKKLKNNGNQLNHT